jgi:hypothetical protein
LIEECVLFLDAQDRVVLAFGPVAALGSSSRAAIFQHHEVTAASFDRTTADGVCLPVARIGYAGPNGQFARYSAVWEGGDEA